MRIRSPVHGEFARPWGASIVVLINPICKYHETVLTLHARYVAAFQVLVFPWTFLLTRLTLPAHVLASTSTHTHTHTHTHRYLDNMDLTASQHSETPSAAETIGLPSVQTHYYTMSNTPDVSW